MSTSYLPETEATRAVITALFVEKPPVLVEVRFPNMGTSPDWYLCEVQEELSPILDRLAPGTEIHLHSVWDLKTSTGGVVLRK